MYHYLKYLIFCFILIIILNNVNGQYNKSKDQNNLAITIRGKAFTFFVVEDVYFRTATIGSELIYKDKHSFGIDISYWRWKFQTDRPDPNPLYDQFEKRIFIYADYKFKFIENKGIHYYLNLYYKYGNFNMWYEGHEDNEFIDEVDFLMSTTEGTFSEIGIGLGIKHYFSSKKRWGIDLSVNAATRFSVDDKIIYDETNSGTILNNVKEQSYLPYFKLNLFYVLKK